MSKQIDKIDKIDKTKQSNTEPTNTQVNTQNTQTTQPQQQQTTQPQTKPEDNFYIPRNYARSHIQPLWATTSTATTRKYTNEQISRLLLNPYAKYKELQEVSNYLLYNSAVYNNFIEYLSNILTWDYVIHCEDVEKINKATTIKRYNDSAKTVHKINVKTIFPAMLKRVLVNGECFFYNMSDNSNSIIIEIDSKICQLAQIDDNNIWRYYINFDLIDKAKIYELPLEIQSAYNDWLNTGKSKDKKIIDDIEIPANLYPVSNSGFAIFVHMRKTPHDYPYFAPLFEDLNSLESDKDYMGDYIKESNNKIIHMRIPTDKESGLPLMDQKITQAYHDSAKEHLPRNCAPLTNPFQIEGITLDKAQSSVMNSVEHSHKIVMQDSGISDSIFNASSTLGLKYSTLADSFKIYPLLYFFENFINLQIKPYKCKVKFLKINHFNQLEWHERYYADLLSGGSRSLFAVTGGIEPYDIINLAKTEDVLGFDDILNPKINASQQSLDDNSSDNGRPKLDEEDASDSTNKVNEYECQCEDE